ncbi:MAG: hypothetical protein HPY51_02370 [Candidatus Omnitrophica bacterium]|nr:hypothetical protein [Candidatus Omnitrophota bacterium]
MPFNKYLFMAAVTIAAAGCSPGQSGPLTISGASSPGLTLKDGRWEAQAMLVDQSAEGLPPGMPPPPKAKSTWLRPSGTIINHGTQTLTDIQLILHARERRSQRIHEKVFSFDIELQPGEEYRIEYQHPSFLTLGSPRIDRCDATLQASVKSATPSGEPSGRRINSIPSADFPERCRASWSCGLAALLWIAQPLPLTPEEFRQWQDKHGAEEHTLSELIAAGTDLGFQATPFAAYDKSSAPIQEIAAPWIAHWSEGHYVAVETAKDGQVWIYDPAEGATVMGESSFRERWSGYGFPLRKNSAP